MEDIAAFIIILAVVGITVAGIRYVYLKLKKRNAEQKAAMLQRQKEADDYWAKKRQQAKNPTPTDYAKAMTGQTKPRPAMKKANVGSSYASTPMTSATSTTSSSALDLNDVITGALVLNELFSHKTGGSNPIDFPKVDSTPSWGFDDSDSRKSISSSMDTSSWSSSDSSSSSDSGPSSDW